jgi:hypothetical protein
MNERIKELAEQATSIVEMVGPEGYTSSYANFDREKFAELIVRECASIASGTAVENPPNDLFYGYNLGVNKTAEKIREHFGVEE